jgi:hypothetical protein
MNEMVDGPVVSGRRQRSRRTRRLVCPACGETYRSLVICADGHEVRWTNDDLCPACNRKRWVAPDEWEPVGPGWMPLVREADAVLASLDPDYRIGQVKEKFGALCFYFDPSPWTTKATANRMYHIEHEIEVRSATICERCGARGAIDRRFGWILTLCDEHKAERNR